MLEVRIKSIKNRFKTLLSKDSFSREKILIKIISKLIYVQRIDLNENLQNDINLLLSIMPVEEADESDIINYNRWLSENILAN
jgi:hypothetical protein